MRLVVRFGTRREKGVGWVFGAARACVSVSEKARERARKQGRERDRKGEREGGEGKMGASEAGMRTEGGARREQPSELAYSC